MDEQRQGKTPGFPCQREKVRFAPDAPLEEVRLAAVADEFSIPRRTGFLEEVLRMEDVDIVDICTPATLHLGQILAALSAGKEVVCEKPLVVSLAEIDRVIAAEKEAAGRV